MTFLSQRLGVDMNNWSMTQPSCGEEALQIAEDSAQSGAVSLVVVDSVSALVPRAELEGDIGQQSVRVVHIISTMTCACSVFMGQNGEGWMWAHTITMADLFVMHGRRTRYLCLCVWMCGCMCGCACTDRSPSAPDESGAS